MGEEEEEEGGVQESGAELCVCWWGWGSCSEGTSHPLERKMYRMPGVSECGAKLHQQQHPPKTSRSVHFLRMEMTKEAACPPEECVCHFKIGLFGFFKVKSVAVTKPIKKSYYD